MDDRDPSAEGQRWVDIQNTKDHDLTLILEPWGDVFSVKPEEAYGFCFLGPAGIPLIEAGDDSITIHGWSGSTVAVYRNGEWDGIRHVTVPAVPKGFRA